MKILRDTRAEHENAGQEARKHARVAGPAAADFAEKDEPVSDTAPLELSHARPNGIVTL